MFNKNILKNNRKYGVVTASLFVAVIMLSGCSGIPGFTSDDFNSATKAAYLAEVNSSSKEFSTALSGFQDAIKQNDTEKIQEKLKDSQSVIDEFSKIETPSEFQDVQNSYTDAFTQLQQALSEYTQNYTDLNSGAIDSGIVTQRIENTQNIYNQALNMLKSADQLAASKS